MNSKILPQIPCKKCGHRLMDGIIKEASIEIKCKKCGEINRINMSGYSPASHQDKLRLIRKNRH